MREARFEHKLSALATGFFRFPSVCPQPLMSNGLFVCASLYRFASTVLVVLLMLLWNVVHVHRAFLSLAAQVTAVSPKIKGTHVIPTGKAPQNDRNMFFLHAQNQLLRTRDT